MEESVNINISSKESLGISFTIGTISIRIILAMYFIRLCTHEHLISDICSKKCKKGFSLLQFLLLICFISLTVILGKNLEVEYWY